MWHFTNFHVDRSWLVYGPEHLIKRSEVENNWRAAVEGISWRLSTHKHQATPGRRSPARPGSPGTLMFFVSKGSWWHAFPHFGYKIDHLNVLPPGQPDNNNILTDLLWVQVKFYTSCRGEVSAPYWRRKALWIQECSPIILTQLI